MMLTVTRMRRKLASTSLSSVPLGLHLRETGWSPLGATAAHRSAELALGQPAPAPLLPELTRSLFHDDLVFLPNAVLYFAIERQRANGQAGLPAAIEAGAIHERGTPPPVELARLTSSLDAALARVAGENLKAAPAGGTWTELPWRPMSGPFVLLKERVTKDLKGGLTAGFPGFPDEVREALRALEDPERRRLALRIKSSEPLFVVRETEAASLSSAADALVDAGLAIRKILVRCHKRPDVNLALLSSEDPARLEGECPHCRSKLREEQFLKGLAPTAVGNSLLDHSHWMTSRAAQSLKVCGVMDGDVLTEHTGEGEECDFLVSLYGSLTVMALRDRSFGLDDARDLFDRHLRFGAQELVAVTTEAVAPEARRRLEEAIHAVPRQAAPAVTYVEGLGELDARIRQVVERANWRALSRLLDKVESAAVPLDLKALVAAKFGVTQSRERRLRWESAASHADQSLHEDLDLMAEVEVKSYS